LTWAEGTGHGKRHPPAFTAQKPRAETRQRLDDPAHRPTAQRRVAGDEGGERVGGENAEQEPRRGAGIAEIDHILGLGQTADPDPVDAPAPVFAALDPGAHRTQRGGGGQHVLAFKQTLDLGASDRESTQHQRPVRHRFVAGHSDPAREGRLRTQRRQRLWQRRQRAESMVVGHCPKAR
jgi:hypothetical protein